MTGIDLLGYVASALVLTTFCMQSMIPLRIAALASNILFATYGYLGHAYPVLALHTVLFPLNALMLLRLLRKETKLSGPCRFRISLKPWLVTAARCCVRSAAISAALGAVVTAALIFPLGSLVQKADAQISCRTMAGEIRPCALPALRGLHLDFIPGCTGPDTKGKIVRFGENAFTCSGKQR